MFERFTDTARRVTVLSQEEARNLNHNYIGTGHILLGLLDVEHGAACQTLTELGVDLDAVRNDIVNSVGGQGSTSTTKRIYFTPLAQKVFELSLRESLLLGHNWVGTEHLLLGLLRAEEGAADLVLARAGVEMKPELGNIAQGETFAEKFADISAAARQRVHALRVFLFVVAEAGYIHVGGAQVLAHAHMRNGGHPDTGVL